LWAKRLMGSEAKVRSLAPIELLVYHALLSALLLLPLAWPSLRVAQTSVGVLRVVLGGALLGLGGGLAFFVGLGRIPASHAGVLTYLEPVVAVGVGAFFFHERIPPVGWLGCVLIAAAGLWVVTERARPAPA